LSSAYSVLTHLECSRCHRSYDASQIQGTCACGAPLLARYDLERAGAATSPEQIAGRPPSLWRYHELIAGLVPRRRGQPREGMTPLLAMPRLGHALGLPGLLMKDESPLPTGTFKARGRPWGCRARRAWRRGRGYADERERRGRVGQLRRPGGTALPGRDACGRAGHHPIRMRRCRHGHLPGRRPDQRRGTADRAAVAERPGYQDVSTLKEPYRLEGKKTIGLEIAEQLGWRVPDVIVCPTGGGWGLIGIRKGAGELTSLAGSGRSRRGWSRCRQPGCAPVVRAFTRGERETEPWHDARTAAFGLTVPALSAASSSSTPCTRRRGRPSPSPTPTCWPASGRSRCWKGPGSARRERPASLPSGGCARTAGWPRAMRSW